MKKLTSILIILILLIIALCVFLQRIGWGEEIEWTGIVVHHSATETGTVESFRREQMRKHKDWIDVAYHFIIYKDGSVHKGRGLDKQGMHGDKRNWSHLGICLIGENDFTNIQRRNLKTLCKRLKQEFAISKIEKHHEQCPGQGLDLSQLEIFTR